jgi:hypothetical protein
MYLWTNTPPQIAIALHICEVMSKKQMSLHLVSPKYLPLAEIANNFEGLLQVTPVPVFLKLAVLLEFVAEQETPLDWAKISCHLSKQVFLLVAIYFRNLVLRQLKIQLFLDSHRQGFHRLFQRKI